MPIREGLNFRQISKNKIREIKFPGNLIPLRYKDMAKKSGGQKNNLLAGIDIKR